MQTRRPCPPSEMSCPSAEEGQHLLRYAYGVTAVERLMFIVSDCVQAVTFSSRPLAVYAARYLQQLEHEAAGKAGQESGAASIGDGGGEDGWKAVLDAARSCQVSSSAAELTPCMVLRHMACDLACNIVYNHDKLCGTTMGCLVQHCAVQQASAGLSAIVCAKTCMPPKAEGACPQPNDGLTKGHEPPPSKKSGSSDTGKERRTSHHPNHHLRKRPVGDVGQATW